MHHRTAFALLALLLAASPGAQGVICPQMPEAVTSVNRDIKSDITASVGTLGLIKAGDVAVKTETQAKNLFEKYPNLDKLLIAQTMAATYCDMLNSTSLPETDKLDRWERFSYKVFNLPNNPPPSTPNTAPSAPRAPENAPNITATGLCEKLSGKSVYINGNGYHGIISPSGMLLQQIGNGSFRFETNIVFFKKSNQSLSADIDDRISGTCTANNIRFSRKLWNGSTHRHSGIIVETNEGTLMINGTFLDEKDHKYVWFGRTENSGR